jgi:hypothetical protein
MASLAWRNTLLASKEERKKRRRKRTITSVAIIDCCWCKALCAGKDRRVAGWAASETGDAANQFDLLEQERSGRCCSVYSVVWLFRGSLLPVSFHHTQHGRTIVTAIAQFNARVAPHAAVVLFLVFGK